MPHEKDLKRSVATVVWGVAVFGYALLLLIGITLREVRQLELGNGLGFDKLAHAAAFSIMGALITMFLVNVSGRRASARSFFSALLFGGSYATFHEGLQLALPGFTFNPLDLLADLVGLAVGIAFSYEWIRATESRAERAQP